MLHFHRDESFFADSKRWRGNFSVDSRNRFSVVNAKLSIFPHCHWSCVGILKMQLAHELTVFSGQSKQFVKSLKINGNKFRNKCIQSCIGHNRPTEKKPRLHYIAMAAYQNVCGVCGACATLAHVIWCKLFREWCCIVNAVHWKHGRIPNRDDIRAD